jgi:hypothetical protein
MIAWRRCLQDPNWFYMDITTAVLEQILLLQVKRGLLLGLQLLDDWTSFRGEFTYFSVSFFFSSLLSFVLFLGRLVDMGDLTIIDE